MKPRATALIFRNGKVLLTRARRTNKFRLPGGNIYDARIPPLAHACTELGRKLDLVPYRATRLFHCDSEAMTYKHYVTLLEIEDDAEPVIMEHFEEFIWWSPEHASDLPRFEHVDQILTKFYTGEVG